MIPVNLWKRNRARPVRPGKGLRVEELRDHPTHPDPTLSIVVVNYRGWPDVARLVAELVDSPALASGNSELIVVDNGSGEAIPRSMIAPTIGLRLILLDENNGFSAGVNVGYRASAGRWILILNPDVVAGPGLIERTMRRIDAYESRTEGTPGVVGFELRNPDGSRQPSIGVFPGLARTLREQVIPRTRRKYQPERKVRPGPVDWATGACLLLNRRMLDELGGMDEDFFLYHEEVALCHSATLRGWGVEFDPEVSVVHLHPLQNRPISPKMRPVIRHGKLLYFRKHRPAWEFEALALAVRAEAGFRGVLAKARGRSRESRSWKAVDRVAALLVSGVKLGGRAVRILADSVDDLAEEPERPGPRERRKSLGRGPSWTHGRPERIRPTSPRKDGP